MEYRAAFVVFLVGLIAGISVFIYWLRRKSEFNLAREAFATFLKAHLLQGTLARQLEDIAAGKLSVHEREKSPLVYLRAGVSMVLGVILAYALIRFTGVGLWVRTLIGSLSILPFIYFVAIAVAEEFDDNRISTFERNTSRQLLLRSQDGPTESDIVEILK